MKTTKKKPLPPDPENQNDSRAEWANAAIRAFMRATGTDLEDAVCDLTADLMHWCDRNGQDFDTELGRGRMHYNEETLPEPDDNTNAVIDIESAAAAAPGLVTDDQKAGISAALEYAYNDQESYLRVGSPTIDYGGDWADARERKATEYRAMGAAARLIEEAHTAEQFDRLAARVAEIVTDDDVADDEQCSGGCGRPANECAVSLGAVYCADEDDFKLYGCPETFEQFEAKREASE